MEEFSKYSKIRALEWHIMSAKLTEARLTHNKCILGMEASCAFWLPHCPLIYIKVKKDSSVVLLSLIWGSLLTLGAVLSQ
jgi:hypothetical protein